MWIYGISSEPLSLRAHNLGGHVLRRVGIHEVGRGHGQERHGRRRLGEVSEPGAFVRTSVVLCRLMDSDFSLYHDIRVTTRHPPVCVRVPLGCLFQYFSLMCREIQAQGGDIFKYAGDAMIVLWPPDEEDSVENRVRRATQAAVAIQTKQHAMDLHEGVQLSVKIGIGLGEVAVLFLGVTMVKAGWK